MRREENKDTQNTFKDVHRCDINKPCVQYCSSNKAKCGILMKKLLGEEVKREKVNNESVKRSCFNDLKIDTLGNLLKNKKESI